MKVVKDGYVTNVEKDLNLTTFISESELRLFHGSLSTVNYSFLHYRDDSSFSRMQEDLSYFLEQLENYEGEYSKTIKSIIAGELENIINSGIYAEESKNVEEDLNHFSEELQRTIKDITNIQMDRVYGLYMDIAKSIIAENNEGI